MSCGSQILRSGKETDYLVTPFRPGKSKLTDDKLKVEFENVTSKLLPGCHLSAERDIVHSEKSVSIAKK